ncbi:hypothetical protein E8L99_06280 [Phreatobacter aquaticus]|uniref:DUF1311 domain-containing protein n=1 Tax=Phreatobacter aquaticus TaxID=2570229 RepID=A0A4D7QFI0_9HYPH|nr:hypothetical protein [Phreatobacter aquaticus]QCK85401.1 hypothetical protein E8L99_06280 [Phreatobacter aquaticus]
MFRSSLPFAIATLLVLATGQAEAQLQLPGAVTPTPQGGSAPSGPAGARAAPSAANPLIPRGPVGPPLRRGEETLPGRTLRFLGQQGSMVINRSGSGAQQTLTINATGVGRRGNDIRNVCTPDLNGGQVVTLRSLGRPVGLSRYEAAFPGCTLVIDMLPDAAIVSAPDGACRFSDDCTVDPTGLWGPTDREIPPDRTIEAARGTADRRQNDARRVLQARLRTTPEGRTFLQEQAGFGAFRERVCRNYGTSDIGPAFCALKYTEARSAAIEARIGAPQAEEGAPAARRPARPRPPPAAPVQPPQPAQR